MKCPICGHDVSLGLSAEVREGMMPAEIEWAILDLWKLREQGKFAEADKIREAFRKIGVELRYGKNFVEYKHKDWGIINVRF